MFRNKNRFEEEDQELTFRLTGSVVATTLPATICYTVYAAAIVWAYKEYDLPIDIPMYIIPVLGVTVGLLLAFRSNLAYDRFWEGRKLWSNMVILIRNLSRQIWLVGPEDSTLDYAQKVTMLKLLIALAYAEKHELRGEHEYHDYEDLKGLLPTILVNAGVAEAAARTEINNRAHHHRHQRDLAQPHSPTETLIDIDERFPLLGVPLPATPETEPANPINGSATRTITRRVSVKRRKTVKKYTPGSGLASTSILKRGRHRSDYSCGCVNLPDAVLDQIGAYIQSKLKSEQINLMIGGTLIGLLNGLQDTVANLHRILTTKLPLAYAIHLRHALVIYTLTLPFQIVKDLGWVTLPVMAIAVFTLFGIENIGFEIENPFGYDPNDLPLDHYCAIVRAEIEGMIAEPYPNLDGWDAEGLLREFGVPDRSKAALNQSKPPVASVANEASGGPSSAAAEQGDELGPPDQNGKTGSGNTGNSASNTVAPPATNGPQGPSGPGGV
ncbi:hypothetical protein HK104_007570 [Borealophlyctis nickersoniae]|nr:hypothetical protein HK104_007570 [Borealophlyctis nickersoniae]